jgi:pimeloyl-ACP methyl ester carboxylesterase
MLEKRFAMYAIARRGRGDTDATSGHSLNDEIGDVVALIQSVGEPVFLLGHSYGAHCALGAATSVPERVRKLVAYEAAWPHALRPTEMVRLEALAAAGRWDDFSFTFFRDSLFVPESELDAVRRTDVWPPIVADAKASLGDLRALIGYEFKPERFKELRVPVLLQIGTESPRDLYVTDALAAVLPRVEIETLVGQAHEGMTTAPKLYAEATMRFLMA